MAKTLDKNIDIKTKVIHLGSHPDKETGAVIPPIYQTSTYAQSSPGKHQGYEYTRSHNPTRTRLEECLAGLEESKYALTTSSGLAAASLVMHALPKGSTILCGDDVYGGTYRLFTTVFNDFHNYIFLDTTDLTLVKSAIAEHKPDMIWLESPTNPLLKMSDISKISQLKGKAKVLVDNTFMSPYFQRPITLGADIVLHSMTKYLNGHSDVVGGALMMSDKKLYDQVWTLQNSMGPSPSPFDSWLVLRGLKTLGIRMERHAENAMTIAKYLEKHPKVESVIYPGLRNHPQYKIGKKQMDGSGGMLTFFIKGGIKESRKFLQTVKLFCLAESLGGVESLVDHPAIMTHASIPKKTREELGITDNLVRLSVGIEDVNDLIKDLETALAKC